MSEENYYGSKFFAENLLAIEMRKTQIFMNKPAYLGLSILRLSEIVMYEYWHDYIKPKKMQNYVKWIQAVLLSTFKRMKFIKTFQKMFKQDLILQTMN